MEQSLKNVLKDNFWIMPATPKYLDDGVPYITSKNIKNGQIDFSKVNYISNESYEKISKNRPILVGDILISMIGTLGEIAEVKKTDGCFYGQNMFLIRLDESKINKRYFINFFKSNAVKRALDGKQNKSTQKYLKAEHIEELIIPMRPLEVQYVIAEQLDKLTNIISYRKNELIQLDKMIQARFVEMFGTPYRNEKGFPMMTVNDVIEFTGGAQPDKKYFEYEPTEDNIRLIQIRDYKTDNYVTYIPKSMSKRFCNADDIMIGRYGPPIFQILKGLEGSYNVALMKATPKMGNKEFVRYFLKQKCLFNYLDGLSQRTAGQSGIDMTALKAYPFQYPPIELQNQFAEFVKKIDKSKLVRTNSSIKSKKHDITASYM